MLTFNRLGWLRFGHDPALAVWAASALPHAIAAIRDPANAHWLRCGGTWFAGVNVLPNTPDGSVGTSGPLQGRAIDEIRKLTGAVPEWDPAQISVIYPGYPRQEGETDTAFGYRQRRDAAHVDGLLRFGPENRRKIGEPHGFVLGIPLTDSSEGASPLVVWEGSHHIIRSALRDALNGHPPDAWCDIDVTEAYQSARRTCFDTCRRVTVHARPGQAYLIHRHTLHGVSPWREGATCDPEGRIIAYFRPVMQSVVNWLAE